MSDGDERDDDAPSGPLLPPDDRLWRHPSEMGAASGASRTGPSPAGPAAAGPDAGPHDGSIPASRPGGRRWAVVAAGLAGATLTLGSLALAGAFKREVVERRVASATSSLPATPVSTGDRRDVAGLVAQAQPWVAGLQVESGAGRRTGSAVLLGPPGTLVTTDALVDGATSLTVTFSDGTSTPASLVGTDPATGLAAVRIADRSRPSPPVAGPGLDVGSPAVLLSGPAGSRSGLADAGTVRGLDQPVATRQGTLTDLIQTDAATTTRTDGGALLAPDGSLAGICLDPSDDPGDPASRSGWAVPVSIAEHVVDDLVDDGRVHHAWLGIEVSDSTPAAVTPTGASPSGSTAPAGPASDSAPSTDRTAPTPSTAPGRTGPPPGTTVTSVAPGSPAAAAGVRTGDRITAMGGAPTTSMTDVVTVLRRHRPGDRVAVTVVRDGASRTTTVVLRDLPS